jgi:hypothetical protein
MADKAKHSAESQIQGCLPDLSTTTVTSGKVT